METGRMISERMRLKSQEKYAAAAKRRADMIRGIDERLDANVKSEFRLTDDERTAVERYWAPYTESNAVGWVEYYSGLHGAMDVRFLPEAVYYVDMDPYFNNHAMAQHLDHKCYYGRMFPEIRQPKTVAMRVGGVWMDGAFRAMDKPRVLEACQNAGTVIVKPATGFGAGVGVRIWDHEEYSVETLERMLECSVLDIVVQEYLRQYEGMAALHRASVNTVRTISFYQKGEVHILSSVVRMGVGGSKVDNISAGGISVGVLPDGRLKAEGFNKYGKRFPVHPDGAVFADCQVPCYGKICDQIRAAHRTLPHFRLISWDFAVDEAGEPVLIELNLKQGELDFHQINNGPLFGDLTEDVLQEVYGNIGKRGQKYVEAYR